MDDFGGRLRQARERRGISLRQIAASTKISPAALEALERNDISKLPGGIFSRAFVKSYAVEVGLDPDETVRQFVERFRQDTAPPSAEAIAAAIPEQERTFEAQKRRAARTLGAIAIAVPVLAVAGYVVLRFRNHQSTPPQQSAPPAAAQPVAPPAPALPSAQSINLDVHPTADCWISLTVDGRKVFARVMKAGEHESHPIEHEAVVEIGDAGAFAFSVDGRDGKRIGDTGQVKTLRLTRFNASQYVQ
jgi:cytoskeletal protein RodZ